jgi:hypothetical protein
MPLDPDIATILETVAASPYPPISESTPYIARRRCER